jgi:hypothetical protein
MDEQHNNLKEIIKTEYLRCYEDPVYFFKKYCFISHPQRGRILFNLYPFQEKVLKEFKNNNYTIINKSRQLGISTLVAGYSLWMMLFNKNKTILCIATKQVTAANMVEKVQFMYQNLPSWLRGTKPESNNKLSLKLPNGSQIVATSASSDAGRSYAVSLLLIDEGAFIEGIDKIYTSIIPTLATGGGCIALSSPNGIGNWFHKTWEDALIKKNSFYPIELKWNLHPERDEKWEMQERANMSAREFAQEYDCDFIGSGNTLIESEILDFYEQTYIQEPVERRFIGGDYWIWQYPDYSRQYEICVDTARGDGSDYSAFHVIDIEACEQVAEYKSQISTREFGHMLVSVASEYNNALLVVENANVGWDVVNTIIERGYDNLYYSPKSYGDMSMDKYLSKMESEQIVPGFTTSVKTRPLVISKLESYLREKAFVFHSKRLLSELRVLIWNNGKVQAQTGYNDDLSMALGIGLFIRDTALKYTAQGKNMVRAALTGITKTGYASIYPTMPNGMSNPYIMQINGHSEDVSWVVG